MDDDPDRYVQLLVHYMKDKSESEKPQEFCLKKIWEACKGNKADSEASRFDNRKDISAFMKHHITKYVVAAMQRFPSSKKLQKLGAGTIWSLCVDRKSTEQLVQEGAVVQMVSVLNRFGNDPTVAKHAIGALQSISVERTARQVLIEANATVAVTDVMKNHQSCERIVYYGCKYLSNSWIVGSKGVTSIPSEQLFAVVLGMVRHQGNGDVVRAGFLALQNFTCYNENVSTLCSNREIFDELNVLLKREATLGRKEALVVAKRISLHRTNLRLPSVNEDDAGERHGDKIKNSPPRSAMSNAIKISVKIANKDSELARKERRKPDTSPVVDQGTSNRQISGH